MVKRGNLKTQVSEEDVIEKDLPKLGKGTNTCV